MINGLRHHDDHEARACSAIRPNRSYPTNRTPPELASALIGEQGEKWMTQLLRKGRVPPEKEIAQAEGFLTGPGSMEDLELFFYDR